MKKVSTGSAAFDYFLLGGYEKDVISTIYGPAGTGKTTACMLACIDMAKKDKKSIFIDTEGGFSIERIQQLSENNDKLMNKFIILKPATFQEQLKLFHNLKDIISDSIGLVVIDTITAPYRIETGKNRNIKQLNADFMTMMGYLTEIVRLRNIPILLTNQVYADFDNKDNVRMVGGDLVKTKSKCLIELQKYRTVRKAIIRNHRSLPENNEIVFEIINEGFKEIK